MAKTPASRILAVVFVFTVLLATIPGLAVADERIGGSVVVGPDETVDGLQAVGGTVVVHGTVDGPLQVVGGDVVVTGTVNGDVDVAAGRVSLSGDVTGDVDIAGGNVEIEDGATVAGDLRIGAGSVRIDGLIDGDVTVGADTITLGSTAVITGDLEYDGTLDRHDEAVVEGSVTRTPGLGPEPIISDAPLVTVPDWMFSVYAFLANLLLGAVLLAVFPRFSNEVSDRVVSEPLRSGGIGFLVIVGVPAVLVLLLLTVVGIPISFIGLAVFVLLLWIGSVYGRFALGNWLLSLVNVRNRWAGLLVGLVVVALLVELPVFGRLVSLVFLALGLGALVSCVYDRYRTRSERQTSVDSVDGARQTTLDES